MGGGGGKSCSTVGYRYYAGLHLVFCHALDYLLKIRVGEKEAWSGAASGNTSIGINQPGLFGGEDREGGVVGTVDVCFGGPGQTRNGYLQSRLGAAIPAFRGLFGLVVRKSMLSANNPYIKEWSILGRRSRIGWRDDLADIVAPDGHVDMNPAHIILEALTNTSWGGLGYPLADIDLDSFQTAANLLKAEGFGLSLIWAKNTSIEDFIRIICDHIDAKVFYGHSDGLLRIKLIRNDYNIGALPVLNESNIIDLVDYTGPAATEAVNQVTVNWVDRDNQPQSVTVQDLASLARTNGQINSVTLDFVGIASPVLAAKVAARELQQLCMPIGSCTLVINRTQSDLDSGDCFNFCWGPLGIENMAMRVDTVEIGMHTDSQIRITAVRDVYGLGAISLTSPGASLWTSPINLPAAATKRQITEITWWQFVREYGESAAVLAELDDTSTMVQCYCDRPSPDAINYEMWTRNSGGEWGYRDTDSFPWVGSLAASVEPEVESTLVMLEGIDINMVRVGTYAALGEELIAITGVDVALGTITVDRGVLDTIPVSHAEGTYLWCHDGLFGLDRTERAVGEAVEVRILPSTSKGRLALADAPTNTITTVGRMMRPYPPGDFKIDGFRWPDEIGESAAVALTWAHRDRLTQTVSFVRQDVGNIGPEIGATYTVRVYNHDDVLVHTEEDITGTSYTFIDGGLRTWTPGDIVTSLWLDAADASTVELVAGAVAQWSDKSGNNNHATQSANAAYRPTMGTENGLGALVFDGSNVYMVFGSAVVPTSHSLFVVFKPTIENAVGAIVGQWAPGETGRFGIIANQHDSGSTTSGYLNAFNGSATQGAGAYSLAISTTITNSRTIIESICTTGSEQWKLLKNGTEYESATIPSVYQGVNTAIGCMSASSVSNLYNGVVCEIVLVSGIVSVDDRKRIEGYLAHKWGVAASLPSDHPYKTDAPTITSGTATPALRFELESVRDGLSSYQKWNWGVVRSV